MYFSYCVYVHVRLMCLCHFLYFIQLQDSHSAVCSGVHSVAECFLGMKVMHFIVVVTCM